MSRTVRRPPTGWRRWLRRQGRQFPCCAFCWRRAGYTRPAAWDREGRLR